MPAKKKRTSSKVKGTKRRLKRTSKAAGPVASARANLQLAPKSRRISFVIKNLVLFAVLFVVSVVIASVSNNEIVEQLFWILAILTAFVAVALVIVLLVFIFAGRRKI